MYVEGVDWKAVDSFFNKNGKKHRRSWPKQKKTYLITRSTFNQICIDDYREQGCLFARSANPAPQIINY
jgi:hypothetical protein